MITIWGRANSVNVQKVLWGCDELGLQFERIDAGMQFGRNHEPDYLAMNPTGRIPTLGTSYCGNRVRSCDIWRSNTGRQACSIPPNRRFARALTAGSTGRCRPCSPPNDRCS